MAYAAWCGAGHVDRRRRGEQVIVKLDVPLGELAPARCAALWTAIGPAHHPVADLDGREVVLEALTMREAAQLTTSLVRAGFTVELVPLLGLTATRARSVGS